MQQTAPPLGPSLAPPLDGHVVARESIDVDAYLSLYRAIGEAVQWDQHLRSSRLDLADFLGRPSTAVFVLRKQVEPVGLCEFTGIGNSEVELLHFGLVPGVQGKRLGSFLLDSALRSVWDSQPQRVWLHTDTNDHPKAISTYERAGFSTYDQRWVDFVD